MALLVFFASVVVPVLKIAGLAFLLVSVQKRSTWRPRQRTVLYRVIEGVGRWSMVDVFMIAILTALVKLGALASIEPGHRCRGLLGRRHPDDGGGDVVRSKADLGRDR